MNNHPNKTIRATESGLEIFYEKKRHTVTVKYEDRGLSEMQLYGNKLNGVSFQAPNKNAFNPLQQKIYRRLLYGLEAVSATELREMPETEKQELTQMHSRAQQVINLWKNQIMASYIDKLFGEMFWHSDIAKEMVDLSNDQEFMHEENTLSFKELGITKPQVAHKLMEHGLLPVNFFYLSA